MVEVNATLAYQIQQLHERFETAVSQQLELQLERETQLSLDLQQERQQGQGMEY